MYSVLYNSTLNKYYQKNEKQPVNLSLPKGLLFPSRSIGHPVAYVCNFKNIYMMTAIILTLAGAAMFALFAKSVQFFDNI